MFLSRKEGRLPLKTDSAPLAAVVPRALSPKALYTTWRVARNAGPRTFCGFKCMVCALGGRELLGANCVNLVNVGDALNDFLNAILAQRAHAFLQRRFYQLGNRRGFKNVALDGVSADEQLV